MNAETNMVIDYFQQICQIPRRSKHEEKIRGWLLGWATSNDFSCTTDQAGNVLVMVPASPGHESSPPLVLQCHMDIVCAKTPDSTHDFDHDPITTLYEGEWLTAMGTTLGADNGIGMELAMTTATSEKLKHPSLELLFTTDEETGLNGATALEAGFIQGKRLINLDSEDVNAFTIGCAGGINTHISIPLHSGRIEKDNQQGASIKVAGARGGHSGVDIHLGHANAIKVLAHVLDQLAQQLEFRIIILDGGTNHNVIPGAASCDIQVKQEDLSLLSSLIKEIDVRNREKYQTTDPDLFIDLQMLEANASSVLTDAATCKVIRFLTAFPHGVSAMSEEVPDVVATSNNLANVQADASQFSILNSQRSLDNTKRDELSGNIKQMVREAGGSCFEDNTYSSWRPDMSSSLLAASKEIYAALFPHNEPGIKIIHAGLECGVIGEKYSGMDIISLGPTIMFPHTTEEKVHVPSIEKFMAFLRELLETLT